MLLIAVFLATAALAATTALVTSAVAWSVDTIARSVHLWRIETGRMPRRITY